MMNSVIYTMLTGQLLAWRTDVSTCRGGQQEPRKGRAQASRGSPFKNDLTIKTAKAGRDIPELSTVTFAVTELGHLFSETRQCSD